MSRVFHIQKDNQKFGPMDKNQVREGIRRGTILPDHLVWTEGMETWLKVRKVSLFKDLCATDLNSLRARCDPYGKVEKKRDRAGIAFMDGDQVLQRSRNLIQALRCSTGESENVARLWCEYRRLAIRFNTLAASGMFPSAILRDNAKEALRKVGMHLKSEMQSAGSNTRTH